jgi:hypothetical protein
VPQGRADGELEPTLGGDRGDPLEGAVVHRRPEGGAATEAVQHARDAGRDRRQRRARIADLGHDEVRAVLGHPGREVVEGPSREHVAEDLAGERPDGLLVTRPPVDAEPLEGDAEPVAQRSADGQHGEAGGPDPRGHVRAGRDRDRVARTAQGHRQGDERERMTGGTEGGDEDAHPATLPRSVSSRVQPSGAAGTRPAWR